MRSLTRGVRSVLRGRISFSRATREAFRRGRVAVRRRREQAMLDELASRPAQLRTGFQSLSSSALLKHFRERARPSFLPGFQQADSTASRQRDLFPDETDSLIESAQLITKEHRWPLLGFGEKEFGEPSSRAGWPREVADPINWHRDPLSGRIWPLDYHAEITFWHSDGSDIRLLWELNRLGHLITLARAYALTREEHLAAEFFAQLESWRQQNPVGRGANWSCAMEVALRAINLLAAFSLFRISPALNEEKLSMLLAMFDQHGAHIRRNLEFSHIATSNHYLSNLAGLLWIAIMLPELARAEAWRIWALNELLHEMDKQILLDGADYEGSTGYQRFILELFLYSFILCRANEIQIEDKYWRKLNTMLAYLGAIVRPDGLAPLIGDSDGGQFLPIVPRSASDHAFLPAIGAAVFKDSQLKPEQVEAPQELLWLLGEGGLRDYEQLTSLNEETSSRAFPDACTYVLRHEDLYLLFNANGANNSRPTSHRHNDVLSVEVSACGCAFIVDPGSYVYTADLGERHLFRSTAYHSTIEIDDAEQQTIREDAPFVTGGEAVARVLDWESTPKHDRVVAEHTGYQRLAEPITHRRTIIFDKVNRWWLIEDEIGGKGQHKIATRFHFDAGLEVSLLNNGGVITWDKMSGARLIVSSLDLDQPPELEPQFTSRHYGSKAPSVSANWITKMTMPCKLRWAIVPVCAGEDHDQRLRVLQR
ncbi:MAG TPA: alginate lyase family protein [Pyrinomonadaceae bacterium]